MSRLQGDDLAILRPFDIEASKPVQHVVVHVGQDELAALKLGPVVHQRLIVEVVATPLFWREAFADEKIGPTRGRDQGVGPFRVSGVRKDLIFQSDPQRLRGSTAGVHDAVRGHHEESTLVAVSSGSSTNSRANSL